MRDEILIVYLWCVYVNNVNEGDMWKYEIQETLKLNHSIFYKTKSPSQPQNFVPNHKWMKWSSLFGSNKYTITHGTDAKQIPMKDDPELSKASSKRLQKISLSQYKINTSLSSFCFIWPSLVPIIHFSDRVRGLPATGSRSRRHPSTDGQS